MARQRMPIGTFGKIRRAKNKSGTPVAVTNYRGYDGKTVKLTRTGRTATEAENNLKAHIAEISRTEDTALADMSVTDVLNKWKAEWVDSAKPPIGTERRYQSVIDNHILAGLGDFTLREARTPQVNEFLIALTKSTSPSTASIARAIISNVMQYGIRMGAIRVNPVDGCAPIKDTPASPKAWTIEEISAMRLKLKDWDEGTDKRGMARVSDLAGPSDFMLGTGCRPGETFAIRWEDLDFNTSPPTVRVHATVVKDRDFKTVIQEHTKTNRVRLLALPPFLVAQLLNRRMEAMTEYVFPSSIGTVRNPDNFRIQWQTALGDGVKTFDELPKTFRSSVGTFVAVEGGADAARGQLGHSTVRTTEQRYLANQGVSADNTSAIQRIVQSGYKVDTSP